METYGDELEFVGLLVDDVHVGLDLLVVHVNGILTLILRVRLSYVLLISEWSEQYQIITLVFLDTQHK